MGSLHGVENDGRDLVGCVVEREVSAVGDLDEGHVRSGREQFSLGGCEADVVLLAEDDPCLDIRVA